MKTYSRLTLAFLLLILVVPQVGADEPPENGKHVEYYENGNKKSESHYKNGKPDGPRTVWYSNGQKKSEDNFKDGKSDGLWTQWYNNGQNLLESHYKDGKRDGLSTSWYPNGQKGEDSHYKNGERDGLSTVWTDNGHKAGESHYKNGKREGLHTHWHANGQKAAERHYKNGEPDGLSTVWYPNGQKKSEAHYKNGNGLETEWHENGQKKSEAHYKNGKRDGLWTEWHENGQKEEKYFKNDQLHGLWTMWHANGQKAGESHYKNGKPDGPRTVWYSNGQKKSEAHYKNGKKHGLFVDWRRDGTKHKRSGYFDPAFHLKEIKKATENRSRVNHKKISKSKEFMLRKSEFLRVHGTIDKKEYQQLFNGFCDQRGVPNCGALAAFGVIPEDFREELFRCSFKRAPEGWEVRIPFGRSDGQVILVKPEDLQPQTAQGSGKTWEPAGTSLGWQILEAAYILHVYKRDANGKMNLRDYMKRSHTNTYRLRPDEILDLLLPTDGNQKKIIFVYASSKYKHIAKRSSRRNEARSQYIRPKGRYVCRIKSDQSKFPIR